MTTLPAIRREIEQLEADLVRLSTGGVSGGTACRDSSVARRHHRANVNSDANTENESNNNNNESSNSNKSRSNNNNKSSSNNNSNDGTSSINIKNCVDSPSGQFLMCFFPDGGRSNF
jgi:hypothetical protein